MTQTDLNIKLAQKYDRESRHLKNVILLSSTIAISLFIGSEIGKYSIHQADLIHKDGKNIIKLEGGRYLFQDQYGSNHHYISEEIYRQRLQKENEKDLEYKLNELRSLTKEN